MTDAGLMYIDYRNRVAYFCNRGTEGEGWRKGYRSYNAGEPYSWEHRVLFWAPDMELAADEVPVDAVNLGACAWLHYWPMKYLPAHVSVDEFRQFITAAGGQSFVMAEPSV